MAVLAIWQTSAQAQKILPLKVDDFTNTKSWWDYHRDGSVAKDPSGLVSGNGFLRIRLFNPNDKQECNAGISERQSIYSKSIKVLTTELRVKVLNTMRQGSRGWGFWQAAKNGRAGNLAWFMEQQKENEPAFTWSRFGTIAKKKIDVTDYNVKTGAWHTYKIVRDLNNRRTDYFIDDKLFHVSQGIAPSGRMGFHAWIDNQIYSRSKGIRRARWSGESALVIDYVKITTDTFLPTSTSTGGSIRIVEKPYLFGRKEQPHVLLEKDIMFEKGQAVVIMTALNEKKTAFSIADKVVLNLKAAQESTRLEWPQPTNRAITRVLQHKVKKGTSKIEVRAENTPFISNLVVLNSAEGKVLLDEAVNKTPLKNGLWKTYKFKTSGKPVVILLAASASESPLWNHVEPETHDDETDDDLRLILNTKDYGWNTPNAIDGNRQFGKSDIVLLREELAAGEHVLKLFAKNKPFLSRVLIYEE